MNKTVPIEQYDAIIGSQTGNDCSLLCALASVHMLFGIHEKAADILELSLWIDPDHADSLRILAACYSELGHHTDVVKLLHQLSKVTGGRRLADEDIIRIAKSLAALGRVEESEKVLREIESKESESEL